MRTPATFGNADGVRENAYRYSLYRKEVRLQGLFETPLWANPNQTINFLMLNPSTADEVQDDPTIRRCRNFARKWGFGHTYISNLFAWRATDPKELLMESRKGVDIVGLENDRWITELASASGMVIAAWGSLPPELEWREKDVLDLLSYWNLRDRVYALALTKAGKPRHPLYLRSNLKPFLYEG